MDAGGVGVVVVATGIGVIVAEGAGIELTPSTNMDDEELSELSSRPERVRSRTVVRMAAITKTAITVYTIRRRGFELGRPVCPKIAMGAADKLVLFGSAVPAP